MRETFEKQKRRIAVVAMCAAVFLVLLLIISHAVRQTVHYPYTELSEGWRLRGSVSDAGENGGYRSLDNIASIAFPRGSKGDYYQVSTALPDMGGIPFPTLMFATRYAACEVSVDGVVIYRSGMEELTRGGFVGSTYHLVTLPEEYEDQFVTITVYRTEDQAGRSLNTPIIGAHEDMEAMLLHRYLFSVGSGFFLVIFGLSFLFLSLLYLGSVPELRPQLLSSLLCTVLGVILISINQVGFLFIQANTSTIMCYFCIYLMIPLAYAMVGAMHVEHILPQRIYRFVMAVSILFVAAACILHFLNLIHLNRMLYPYYLIAVISMVIIFRDIVRGVIDKTLTITGQNTLVGLCILMVLMAADIILVILSRVGVPVEEESAHIMIAVGATIFAGCQIVNYFSFVSESGARQKDYAFLQDIAYQDSLTGLANRARADMVFEELNKSHEDFCLVSVDVNGLTDTNDRSGHLAGDRLLRDYAKALKDNFGDEELCARMGGDEFLVVMKKTTPDGFGVRLRRLYNDLDRMNEEDKTLFRSAAIGYAFRHECHGGDAHAVYLLADERMFENKREQHIRYRIKDRG